MSSLNHKISLLLMGRFLNKFIPFNRFIFVMAALLYIMCYNTFAQNKHLVDSLENELNKLNKHKNEIGKSLPELYDTLSVNILYKIGIEFVDKNSDSAMEYANQSLILAEKINYQKGVAYAYNVIGMVFDITGDYSSSMNYYDRAFNIFKSLDAKDGLGKTYDNIGIIYREKGDFENALKNYL